MSSSQPAFADTFTTVIGPWSEPVPLTSHRLVGEFIVVPDGMRQACWDWNGKLSFVDGPRSHLQFGGYSRPCRKYVAGPGQFIALTLISGERLIKEGPASLWEDPVEHAAAEVFESMEVSTNEAIVVYTPEGEKITRKVVRGPTLYAPVGAQEWQHEFNWHGTDYEALNSAGVNRKRAGALKFKKLRLVPDQLYYDVEKVRTKDDALLTVKTMVFFRLKDVNKMIETTHDPISDLINSIAADVIATASALSFEEFRANAKNLNDLMYYPTLTAAGAKMGYEVSKIVFRGYEASQKLQLMHDEAIEQRTRLLLLAESEDQKQELEDLRQRKNQQRSLKDREEEARSKDHDLEIGEKAHRAKLLAERLAAEQGQSLKQAELSDKIAEQEKQAVLRETHLKALQEMGVDLNKFLSQKADRIIRLDMDNNGSSAIPHLHLDGTSKL